MKKRFREEQIIRILWDAEETGCQIREQEWPRSVGQDFGFLK